MEFQSEEEGGKGAREKFLNENNKEINIQNTESGVETENNFKRQITNPTTSSSTEVTSSNFSNAQVETFKLYPYRWLLQFCFSLAFAVSGILMVGFSPIAPVIAKIYSCNVFLVEIQAIIFVIMYIPSNFVVIKVQTKYGLRSCVTIGACFLLVGAWLRQLVQVFDNFGYALIGTTVAAFGQGFFINSSSKLASAWFGDKERALSTALGGLAMPIGCIIGFVIAAAMIGDKDDVDTPENREKFGFFLLIQNCVSTLGTIPLILFAKNKPPTPPSQAASRVEKPLDFKKEIRNLVKNKSYLLLSISFMSLDSICTAMSAVVASLTKPYNYSSLANAAFGGIFIIFGVIGSFILSIYLDKNPRYKFIMISIALLAILSTALSIFSLPSGNAALFGSNVAVMGFSTIPMTPIAFAFAVELTYPTPEAMSNGMMILPNKLYGALMGILSSYLCNQVDPRYAIALFTINSCICALSSFFLKEELRRLRFKEDNSIALPISPDQQ